MIVISVILGPSDLYAPMSARNTVISIVPQE